MSSGKKKGRITRYAGRLLAIRQSHEVGRRITKAKLYEVDGTKDDNNQSLTGPRTVPEHAWCFWNAFYKSGSH